MQGYILPDMLKRYGTKTPLRDCRRRHTEHIQEEILLFSVVDIDKLFMIKFYRPRGQVIPALSGFNKI